MDRLIKSVISYAAASIIWLKQKLCFHKTLGGNTFGPF